ncbi:MAG: aconitase/3-isopropylmalate dehydratase large subunit family protein [Acidobacteriota bacterium]|nr:aconitase/3-isopropylmalate dehydratase large subunit family protein [Acidobacteriota bacterium]
MPGSPQTFAQKVLARAAGLESTEIGQIVDARPDVALSHDNSAAIRAIWQELGQERLAIPDRMAITLDHAVPAPTARHAQNHAEIREFVAEQGIASFFEIGRGICHQVLSEEVLVRPGQLILGADSHTPHFGWMGSLGAGVGRSEMAVLWATGELWMRVPESLRVELEGELGSWVTSKDLALHLIGALGQDGALYRSVEFAGPGLVTLSLESRMALANMMAEMGAKNSYLEPDEAVFRYLGERLAARAGTDAAAETSGLAAGAIYPDPDAAYAASHSIDLSQVQVQVACPHRVDNTRAVSELSHIHVDQAFIGTCTNGRAEDIEQVHRVLVGRHIASRTRLLIIPASSQVLGEALARGWVQDLMQAGAVFGTPGCGPCMGNHLGVLAPGEVCISSANRNFRGRMGTPDAEIYLASPAVVAASAVLGRIASPEEVMA